MGFGSRFDSTKGATGSDFRRAGIGLASNNIVRSSGGTTDPIRARLLTTAYTFRLQLQSRSEALAFRDAGRIMQRVRDA